MNLDDTEEGLLISPNESDIKIRVATQQDFPNICQLNIDEYWDDISGVNEDELFSHAKWWGTPELLAWHQKVIQNCQGEIILAYDRNNSIIGQLDYVQSADFEDDCLQRLHIIWLLVAKKYRRRGIASQLITYLRLKFPNKEIWVEPEDTRSLKLYQKNGTKRKSIDNLVLSQYNFANKIDQSVLLSKITNLQYTSYEELRGKISRCEIKCLIGKYYAPEFDIEQLRMSEPIHDKIWGKTSKAKILKGKFLDTEFNVILTQYLRLYVSPEFKKADDFIYLFKYLFDLIFKLGFSEIFVQIFQEDDLTNRLIDTGFKMEEAGYPVFNL